MSTTALFIATRRFDPSDPERWNNYANWAKIPGLKEVVSLDGMLCSRLVNEFNTEDWLHIVNEDFRLNYFYHLDYLISRVSGAKPRNILGLYRNQEAHITIPPGPGGFEFMGYDLIEEQTQISAVTNCGGFPEVFANSELNSCGLLSDFARACEVRRLLKEKYPEEPHANCEQYAIWRLNESE
jgi:hypothetical protein